MAGLDKWLYNFARRRKVPWIGLTGETDTVGATSVSVLLKDVDDRPIVCSGTSVPTGAGYAKGCIFIKTNASTGVKSLYENIGTTSVASFNLIGDVTAAEIALAEGSILVGNSSGVSAALSAKTSGRILVGDGTTVASVAVTGDITITTAGVVAIGAKKVTAGMTAIADGKILIGGAGGAGAEQTLTGDVTVTNAGVTAIGAGKVTAAMLANGAGVAALLTAGLGGSTTIIKSETGAKTIVAADATKIRACLVVAVVTEAFATGDTSRTIVTVGEADTPDKMWAATVFPDGLALGTVLVGAFTNAATKAITVTSTAAAGTGTGGVAITVLAIPTT
jgi:hypothetical protein